MVKGVTQQLKEKWTLLCTKNWAQNSERNDLELWSTALGFITPSKSTFTGKGVHSVPIANVDDKRRITATFCVKIVGDFLPVQLICGGATDKCHPEFKFPESFLITQSQNHCSNEDIVM